MQLKPAHSSRLLRLQTPALTDGDCEDLEGDCMTVVDPFRHHAAGSPSQSGDHRDQTFFRISHCQLGRHKAAEKGLVQSCDLAVQVMEKVHPVAATATCDCVQLHVSMRPGNHTLLATWMSDPDPCVTFDELRKHWQVWQPNVSHEGQQSKQHSNLWNVDKVLRQYFGPEEVADAGRLIRSIVDARAMSDREAPVPGHVYVPDFDDEELMLRLVEVGMVLEQNGGFMCLRSKPALAMLGANLPTIFWAQISNSWLVWLEPGQN